MRMDRSALYALRLHNLLYIASPCIIKFCKENHKEAQFTYKTHSRQQRNYKPLHSKKENRQIKQ